MNENLKIQKASPVESAEVGAEDAEASAAAARLQQVCGGRGLLGASKRRGGQGN